MLVASADELEDQVGGACVVAEVAYLVADQECRACVVAQPAFECAGGLLPVEVEQQVDGGGEERGVSGEDGLMGDVSSASSETDLNRLTSTFPRISVTLDR